MPASNDPRADFTPAEYRSATRHAGHCGNRAHCWRESCRREFGTYPTVEILPTGLALAYCHGLTTTVDATFISMIKAAS